MSLETVMKVDRG